MFLCCVSGDSGKWECVIPIVKHCVFCAVFSGDSGKWECAIPIIKCVFLCCVSGDSGKWECVIPIVKCVFLCCVSGDSGKWECVIPIVVNGDWARPYQYLQVFAELSAPTVWFLPPAVGLTPAPLKTEVSFQFTILCSQYKE